MKSSRSAWGFTSHSPSHSIQITSRGRRTSGRSWQTTAPEGFRHAKKGNPIFRPTAITWYVDGRGNPAIRVVAAPSNYERRIAFHKRLASDAQLQAEVATLEKQYQRIRREGKGSLQIPSHMPVTIGTANIVSIGEKYLVFPLRSEKVSAYPGLYHFIGGVPSSPSRRAATNKLIRQNVREEIDKEFGVHGKKIKLGKPLDVHFSFRRAGTGFNILHSVEIKTTNPDGFLSNHLAPIDPKDHSKGFTLRKDVSEKWEAKHFAVIPNTQEGVANFLRQNARKMTPILRDILRKMVHPRAAARKEIIHDKKIFFFDIDGTLINATSMHVAIYRRALKEVAGVTLARDEDLTKEFGKPAEQVVRGVLATYGVHSPNQQLVDAIRARYQRVLFESKKLLTAANILPGVKELLSRLRKQGKILWVVSGNPTKVGKHLLKETGLARYFHGSTYSDSSGGSSPSLTREEIVAIAIRNASNRIKRRFDLQKMVVVGDTPSDVAAAKHNRVDSVAVTTGIFSRKELAASRPTHLLKGLIELIES